MKYTKLKIKNFLNILIYNEYQLMYVCFFFFEWACGSYLPCSDRMRLVLYIGNKKITSSLLN